jgi:hypothetical protein
MESESSLPYSQEPAKQCNDTIINASENVKELLHMKPWQSNKGKHNVYKLGVFIYAE